MGVWRMKHEACCAMIMWIMLISAGDMVHSSYSTPSRMSPFMDSARRLNASQGKISPAPTDYPPPSNATQRRIAPLLEHPPSTSNARTTLAPPRDSTSDKVLVGGSIVTNKHMINDDQLENKHMINDDQLENKHMINDDQLESKHMINDDQPENKHMINDDQPENKHMINDEHLENKHMINDKPLENKQMIRDEQLAQESLYVHNNSLQKLDNLPRVTPHHSVRTAGSREATHYGYSKSLPNEQGAHGRGHESTPQSSLPDHGSLLTKDKVMARDQNDTLDFRIAPSMEMYTASGGTGPYTVAKPWPMKARLTKLYIGGLFELTDTSYTKTGKSELAAATLALRHINEQQFIPGYYLDMVYNDTRVSNSQIIIDRFLILT